MNRRQFLKKTGAVSAGLMAGCASLTNQARSRPIGANEDVRIAVVGFHKQGAAHIKSYRNVPGVRIVALCDVDEQVMGGQVSELAKNGIQVTPYRDMRALFDSKEVDAVSIATPNHWHALATVWACQAGKDVFVEKPISHCIWEGRKMVDAVRKYGRMVQGGLNQRSRPAVAAAFDFVHSGQIGKILRARAWDYKRRDSIGKIAGVAQIPETIDYNLWTGPAPLLPLLRKELHYDWHWQWATGNGEIGNNGVHWLDVVRWGLRKNDLPAKVISFGGRYGYVDDGQTPNTFAALFSYGDCPVVYESRGLPRAKGSDSMDDVEDETATGRPIRISVAPGAVNSGAVIVCEGGYCHGNAIFDNDGKEMKRFDEPGNSPQHNFINGVRSRKRADLKTDILDAHLSASLCHMGNISTLCGGPASFDKLKARFADQPQAARAVEQMIKHLAANGIDVAKQPVTVGPLLRMNSERERFTGEHAERANLFVRDSYREPFVIRDAV